MLKKSLKKTVIVEGFDHTGKTTLIEKLAKLTDAPVVHSPGPVSREELLTFLHRAGVREEEMIYDRYPLISERIYGQVLRGKAHALPDIRPTKDPVVIWCRPRHGVIRAGSGHFENSAQMEGVVDHSEKLMKAYDEYFITNPPNFIYDAEDDPQAIKLIIALRRGGVL